MVELGPRQIELKVHGLTTEDHGRVPARVFANKLKQLVSSLEAADRFANGRTVHDYVLASMHMSEPTAVLREIPILEAEESSSSAIPVFNDAVEGIKTRDVRLEKLAPVIKSVGLLTSGASTKYGFAEVRTTGDNIIRIDDFLRKRAAEAKRAAADPWFSGAVYSTFDGVLDYVDARGALPQIKLTLTAGGKELDCICRKDDIETLGASLHKRVRVAGRAIYSASSPLPLRVEVTSVDTVPEAGDFSRWRGSFQPFELTPWEYDA